MSELALDTGRYRWLLRPASLFDASFIVFTAAGLLVRPTPLWALLFYVLLVPIFLRAIIGRYRRLPLSREIAIVALLLVYFGASILWSAESDSVRRLKYAAAIFVNGAFIAAAITFFSQAGDRLLRLFATSLFGAAAINVAISFGVHLFEANLHQRLEGWAETRHSVLGGLVVSVIFTLLLVRISCDGKSNWRLIAIGVALLGFIALTRSRAAAVTAMAGIFIALLYPNRRAVALIVVVAALPVIIAVAAEPDRIWRLIAEMAQRGDSQRMMIWKVAWEQIMLRPILGHGLANIFPLGEPFSHPHSLYISALYYGGIVGFALLAALLGSLGVRVIRELRGPNGVLFALLYAHVLLAGAFTLSQPFRDVSELWLILWLPIAMIVGLAARAKGQIDGVGPAPLRI